MSREGLIIFAGPSLYHVRARVQAKVLPPIRRRDLEPALSCEIRKVGIIDGEFDQSLAVAIPEIRQALRQGVHVYGAASMGALRAAECAMIGMVGMGWVFDRFRAGDLQRDDEVALIFDPVSYKPLSTPLVNIRWTCSILTSLNIIDDYEADAIVESAKVLHYTDRSIPALKKMLGVRFRRAANELEDIFYSDPSGCDRKAQDALLLIKAMEEVT